jgi:OOP family OmpA-OmpF porin
MTSRWRGIPASVLVGAVLLGTLAAIPVAAGPASAADAGSGAVRVDPGGEDIRALVLDLRLGSSDLDGAVSTSRTGSIARVTLDADVLFDFDRADLNPAATGRLSGTAGALPASSGPILVDGYTDAKGDPAYNQQLSERRARAVADALGRAQPSVGPRLLARGHGAASPVAPNTNPNGSDNPPGRSKNRRVTITYTVSDTRR